MNVGCLEIRKTEIARHIFKKRNARLDYLIAVEVGLSDTHTQRQLIWQDCLVKFSVCPTHFRCRDTRVGGDGQPGLRAVIAAHGFAGCSRSQRHPAQLSAMAELFLSRYGSRQPHTAVEG